MKKSKMTLFAIYKNGIHLGNEKGKDIDDAINKYLVASFFEEFLDDLEFKSLYSGKIAMKSIHYS
ncbi:hypothetical protein [Psychroserpens ponticola]|uniref:Uncharacterized protein n=1 Tax=Psychroserpens ponticola TaxID=2932268 RepID=A0ABY7RY90_9FLAO|nr:hypothetical protein [Psychroserpens ponticola]WCO01998.1 hypothetical protein MUN68_000560 [Psychroserpens ponticola]